MTRSVRLCCPVLAVLAVLGLGACSGGDDDESATEDTVAETTTTSAAETTTTTAPEEETTESLPAGATAGLDDLDGDGEMDPTCGTQDFGAGLVLRVPCDPSGLSGQPPEGVTLTPESLYRFPTDSTLDLSGISADAVIARDADGGRVYVLVYNSDGLFETGSDVITSPDTFTNTIRLINDSFPGSSLSVRGHTDSTGTPAANQSLSERRAASVQSFLTSNGVQASEVTSVGFGPDQPLAVEDTDAGRQFNRRVELAIRVP